MCQHAVRRPVREIGADPVIASEVFSAELVVQGALGAAADIAGPSHTPLALLRPPARFVGR